MPSLLSAVKALPEGSSARWWATAPSRLKRRMVTRRAPPAPSAAGENCRISPPLPDATKA